MIQTILLLFAVTSDSFVYMLEKGATSKEIRFSTVFYHSLIFAVVSALLLIPGLSIGQMILENGMAQFHHFIIIVVMLVLSFIILLSTFRREKFVERLGEGFEISKTIKHAFYSGVDVVLAGTSLSASVISPTIIVLLLFVITMIVTLSAGYIGYYKGAAYQKVLGAGCALIYFVMANYTLYFHFIAG